MDLQLLADYLQTHLNEMQRETANGSSEHVASFSARNGGVSNHSQGQLEQSKDSLAKSLKGAETAKMASSSSKRQRDHERWPPSWVRLSLRFPICFWEEAIKELSPGSAAHSSPNGGEEAPRGGVCSEAV